MGDRRFKMSALAYSIVILLAAVGYIFVYNKTRKSHFTLHDQYWKLAVLVVYNWLILRIDIHSARAIISLTSFMMLLIADFDFLVLKIPAEMLVITALGIIYTTIYKNFTIPALAAALIFGIVLFVFSKKIGIAPFDVILTFLISILLTTSFISVIQYYALVLILFGLAGLSLKKVIKKEQKIPLAPLIVIAFVITNTITV